MNIADTLSDAGLMDAPSGIFDFASSKFMLIFVFIMLIGAFYIQISESFKNSPRRKNQSKKEGSNEGSPNKSKKAKNKPGNDAETGQVQGESAQEVVPAQTRQARGQAQAQDAVQGQERVSEVHENVIQEPVQEEKEVQTPVVQAPQGRGAGNISTPAQNEEFVDGI